MENLILKGLAREALQAKRDNDVKRVAKIIVNDVISRRVEYHINEMRTSAEKEQYINMLQGDVEELIKKSMTTERNVYAVC